MDQYLTATLELHPFFIERLNKVSWIEGASSPYKAYRRCLDPFTIRYLSST